ncbi:MAG: 2-phospho-L-lactate guanylyltransferase [Deltaproteobacteria bacterium]|nr:2-phospho-L-lactate guanylyltransferase [Deltaproteobacteria bacterium]MBW2446574.1 2-phospho-L-lactate guanylyltransferase [Deltaproteobacteria bacterium]
MIDALVPVGRLADAKSRLLPGPYRAAAAKLTLAMLDDVLAALAGAERIERVAVVTPDETVARHTEAAGATAILQTTRGLNPGLDDGAAKLAHAGQDGLLVILGDVAGATSRDLDAACEAADELGRPGAVLCPSGDGGTAVLLRTPHDAIPARFGSESAARHREAASDAGVPLRELTLPSLAIDLDEPADVRRFLATDEGGTATRRALAEIGWAP